MPWSYDNWSNLALVTYLRTYARDDKGPLEEWPQTVERVIRGNIEGHESVSTKEANQLEHLLTNRKSGPAGRGWWFSGASGHKKLGGVALNNCWFVSGDDWENLVLAMDLLMLGGGVGMSVEHKYVSKLAKIKNDVSIYHHEGKDADFIVPDTREGWCQVVRKVLKSFFQTGKSFNYSTVCVRGYGEKIKGFGGTASGPIPLIKCVENICKILKNRSGRHIRPVDMMDLLCCIGEMVVAGNVRRSAILIMGDAWDKEYLRAKRWDLGELPTYRAMANLSIVCDDTEDLHPSFWKTYEHGEPFGIVNRKNIQKFARMGEKRKDYAIGVNPCAEATLTDGEPCNLQEIFLPNLKNEKEFLDAGKLMHRWGKRVTMEHYHNKKNDDAVKKYRRIGTGITGCLESKLFNPKTLDTVYNAIQEENVSYSKELGIPESIRTTVVKPSGTMSIVGDCAPGIHPYYSSYYIRRVRFSAGDQLVPLIRAAGHHVENVLKFDGSYDPNTVVADFYCEAPAGSPVADKDWDTWKQLDVLKMAQAHWADQAVSVTVYYDRKDLPELKVWLSENLKYLKTISFLCHSDHGFKQAPLEAISGEEYKKYSDKINPVELAELTGGYEISSQECEGGACPIK